MIEQLRSNVNKIRRRLSLKFLLISYLGCSIFNIFFGKYMELGLVFIVIISFIWVIKNTDLEYDKIKKSVIEYRGFEDTFVISGLINARSVILFISSYILFLVIQQLIHPLSGFGAFLGFFLYVTVIMFAINGEYNPLALDKQKPKKYDFDTTNNEYIFGTYPEQHKEINDTWYRDVCMPGNPIFVPPNIPKI